jgi:arginyl-tRNA synthetase
LEFPEVVAEACKQLSPAAVCKYAYDLSDLANKYYESTPILSDKDKARRDARLVLVASVAETLKSGLHLLGITAPEKI